MTVDVFAADEQADHPVDHLRWLHLAAQVLAAEGVRGDTEVSLLFVDEPTITDLNERFLGKDGPTDVLAVPDRRGADRRGGRSPDSGGTGPGYTPPEPARPARSCSATWSICPAVAARNAPEHAGTYDDEIALLVVHGILHLLGMDHEDDDEAEAMERRERELLARFHGPAPSADACHSVAVELAPRLPSSAGADRVVLSSAPLPRRRRDGLTRMNRVKALTLRTTGAAARGGCVRLVEHPERFLNPLLFVSCCATWSPPPWSGSSPTTCSGRGAWPSPPCFEVVVIFVFAEAVPKTWAVQHPERAALLVAPRSSALTVASRRCGCWPPGLIGLANLILPGKGLQQRPVRLRGGAAGHGRRGRRGGRDRERGAGPHPLDHRVRRHRRPRGDGARGPTW